MTIPTCSGYHFPRDVIQRAVWMYLRFTLSYLSAADPDEHLVQMPAAMRLRTPR